MRPRAIFSHITCVHSYHVGLLRPSRLQICLKIKNWTLFSVASFSVRSQNHSYKNSIVFRLARHLCSSTSLFQIPFTQACPVSTSNFVYQHFRCQANSSVFPVSQENWSGQIAVRSDQIRQRYWSGGIKSASGYSLPGPITLADLARHLLIWSAQFIV